jgi:hypothetical protein
MTRRVRLRPFVGVDGEGCGRDRAGRQHYMLLRAGPHELYTGKPLSTSECLDFLCGLPGGEDGPLLVGFHFGYDITMILRDLPPGRLSNAVVAGDATDRALAGFAELKPGTGLLDDKATGRHSRYTYFESFGIDYLPGTYFRVCRLQRGTIEIDGRTIPTSRRIEGTSRTIYETAGFFRQMTFLAALQSWGIGRRHWATIAANKAARATWDRIDKSIRTYNKLECDLLAELMETFRASCHAMNLRPQSWAGAGWLAAAEHAAHGTIRREALAGLLPAGLEALAWAAYYGGRFETTRAGEIAGPVYEYDLNSAHPASMTRLPCRTPVAGAPSRAGGVRASRRRGIVRPAGAAGGWAALLAARGVGRLLVNRACFGAPAGRQAELQWRLGL